MLYEDPLFSTAIIFIESFPVGLVINLYPAAILRRKPQQGAPVPLPETS
jgi:hypothetical protein